MYLFFLVHIFAVLAQRFACMTSPPLRVTDHGTVRRRRTGTLAGRGRDANFRFLNHLAEARVLVYGGL